MEDRFDHAQLGDDLKIESVTFHSPEGGEFSLLASELPNLEKELGRLTVHDISVDERNASWDLDVTATIGFSDGFNSDTPTTILEDRLIVRFVLPDDAGFHGQFPFLPDLIAS